MRVTALYARKLLARGHDVRVVMVRRPVRRWHQRALDWVRGTTVARPTFPVHYFQNLPLTELDHAGPVTARDVPEADVVIATYWRTAPWVAALPAAKGAKAYFMQDYGTPGQPLDALIPTWRLPLHIITISQWLADLVREHVDRPVDIVMNAVETDLFHAPPRGKQPQPTVGLMYHALPTKGTATALAAAELARQRVPDLRLRTFGRQPEPDLPLPAWAEHAGRVADAELRNVYAGCDAWLFPSRREGFGLPILEAMACRTPVIGTPAGAAPELLGVGGGVLVPHDDATALADAIVRICGLPEPDWRALSDAAYKIATSYTWDDAADAFEAALRRASVGGRTTAVRATVGAAKP